MRQVYEGEVTELTPEETENPMGGYPAVLSTQRSDAPARLGAFDRARKLHRYGKAVSHVIIGLKTTKGTKQVPSRSAAQAVAHRSAHCP